MRIVHKPTPSGEAPELVSMLPYTSVAAGALPLDVLLLLLLLAVPFVSVPVAAVAAAAPTTVPLAYTISISHVSPTGEHSRPSSAELLMAMLHSPEAHCCHEVVRQLKRSSCPGQAVPGVMSVVALLLLVVVVDAVVSCAAARVVKAATVQASVAVVMRTIFRLVRLFVSSCVSKEREKKKKRKDPVDVLTATCKRPVTYLNPI